MSIFLRFKGETNTQAIVAEKDGMESCIFSTSLSLSHMCTVEKDEHFLVDLKIRRSSHRPPAGDSEPPAGNPWDKHRRCRDPGRSCQRMTSVDTSMVMQTEKPKK